VECTYPSAVTPDTPLMTRKKTFARDTHAISEAQAKIQNQGHKTTANTAVVALNQLDAARVDCRHEWTLTGFITDGYISLSKSASASLIADVTARVTTQGQGYDVRRNDAYRSMRGLTN
jgi:hypothetical protein